MFFQAIEDFQQRALQQGSEDPQSAEILQKCEEYLPGQVLLHIYTSRDTLTVVGPECCKLGRTRARVFSSFSVQLT